MASTSDSDFQQKAQIGVEGANALAGNRFGVGRVAYIFGIATASFDVFLTTTVAGFTLRIHQMLLLISICTVLYDTYSRQKFRLPVGFNALFLWTVVIFLFVPHTTFVARSLGYALWLLIDVAIVVIGVQLFGRSPYSNSCVKWYLVSFSLMSLFGLLQLVLALLHLPPPFVKQWLIPGVWPRLNGFSYEPSYYATYLLLGWVLSAWLLERGSGEQSVRAVRWTFALSTVALLLSTSRIGWLMMLVWCLGWAVRNLRRLKSAHLSLGVWAAVTCTCALLALLLSFHRFDLRATFTFLSGGTGLYGTPAHSVNAREASLQDTLALIKQSPIYGYSLGGVATSIALARNEVVSGNEEAKHNEGGTVFAEVLAASGIVGVIPFVWYVTVLIVRPLRVARINGVDRSWVLSGLVWSLVMELIMLQFNQNILRPYLWFHIAVLSAVYASANAGKPSRL